MHRSTRRRHWSAVAVAAAAAVALAPSNGALAEEAAATTWYRPGATVLGAPGDWPAWQKDLLGTRFNPFESRITPDTVGQLKLKWAYTYADVPFATTGSQPAVVDGTLYVGAPDAKFLALDAVTGATRWTFDLTGVSGPVGGQNTNQVRDGAAVAGRKVYFGDSRGWLYALDKDSGTLAWATRLDEHPSTRLTSSPMVFDGRVYIGVSSIEAGFAGNPSYPCCTHRGQVVALDAATGTVAWRYRTVRPAEPAGSWPSGAPRFAPSGGAVWASPVVEPVTRTVFVGTGQNYTGAEGDIDSMLALSADTGEVRWKRRMTFPDTYTQACTNPANVAYCPGRATGTALDFDFGATANVFLGGGRILVGAGQKSGQYHAFDARTGELVWQTRLAVPNLAAPDPGQSGIEWGTSWDGRRIYAATWNAGPGTLYALNPADGRVLWSTPHPADGCLTGGAGATPQLCAPAFTPAVSTSPGLVYEGSADGKFRVFSAETGAVLWTFDAVRDFQGVNGVPGRGTAISGNGGAVISNGMVYVQAGYYPFYPSDKGHVLLAFGL
jgi:polyvinyl alcohol dehydrogenase (cytochrome)